MITFFKTRYIIARPPGAVYHFLSDFRHYFDQLPEFHGAQLSTDDAPVAPGKRFIMRTDNESHEYETHVCMLRMEEPTLIEYEYTYRHREADGEHSPMPWQKARVTMQLQPYEDGTQVNAEMHVFGVQGFFARWKVSALKTACARAQKVANDSMVRVAERAIPDASEAVQI
ncbi:SRPBCC domain-containing protein [Marinimicrobium sp. ABcell2]|uniref:SRPBCC domain-containing protein n=1 Tax=Marinimicrobium sp. ABcell2 TaxID=3069751 RepID=UPI0027AF8B8F|nr:SRPBCC family protein [Marinimicrobium sp. ABcell2]MDQ2075688.1 SRPBCC family protein [Marinimicrobium sp. ABcell2]